MNREGLLAVKSRRVETVEVEGIGTVHVRVLNAKDALALEALLIGGLADAGKLQALVIEQIRAFICDESGVPLLSREDAAQLIEQWSANQVRAIIKAGVRLNALGDASVEEAGGN